MSVKIPKIGDIYFSVFVDDDGSCSTDQHYVRTIRKGVATATDMAWSRKRKGRLLWEKNIPSWARTKWRLGSTPWRIYPTKLKAINAAIKLCTIDFFLYDDTSREDAIKARNRALSTLQRMKTNAKKQNKKTKGSTPCL